MIDMRILLVDDEAELVSTLAERLAFRGIEADWATNEEEVLRCVEANKYDFIILDMKMPKLSGLELKKKIDNKCLGTKYIFITGHGSENDYQEASAESGVVSYLIKPVSIDALIAKMNDALEDSWI